MNIIVLITTFNRSEELEYTLKSLCFDKDFLAENNVQFEVWDDKSDNEHSIKNMDICQVFGAKYLTSEKNYGREEFWRLHKKIFTELSKKEFDYVFSLQDDFSYVANFFTNTLNIFKKIEKNDNKVVCLNLRNDRINKKVTWTKFQTKLTHIDEIELYKIGWVDCIYLANRYFFELLNFNIFPVDKKRFKSSKKSSGVGEQISKRVVSLQNSIYQLKKPMTEHMRVNDSKMHKWRNKL